MNPLTQSKKITALPLLIALILFCFAFLPTARAVLPPPDGGYPGFNTAEGQNALFSLTTGTGNTAVGWLSLRSLTEGRFNTAIGAGALLSNTGEVNTATGTGALLSNTTGGNNTANGVLALFNNTIGVENTACGSGALLSNGAGNENTATGFHALFSNTSGIGNTAVGWEALSSNGIGGANTAIGRLALSSLAAGNGNTAIGHSALINCTGAGNIAVGSAAGDDVTTASNVICIGSLGANVNNSCFIGFIRGIQTVNNDAIPVLIDSAGQLGTISSSRRFKDDIMPMDKASEAILALNPVTFHYKNDKTDRPEFGLIAEEVAEVNPDLVVRDGNGEIYTVRYDQVNAMLLNEFLKEHRTVQELKSVVAKQEATAAQQQKQIEALTAGLQKVSAQLEVSKAAPQTVVDNQ
jgi:Chaperone of endosialidase